MRLRLKEEPKEWIKFTAAMALLLSVLAVVLWKRQALSQTALTAVLIVDGLALLVCVVRPRWYRSFYRGGMTISFHVGQLLGKILLALFFLVVLTPMALALRLFGKDLLRVKRNSQATSYWQSSKMTTRFDRQF